MNWLGRLLFGAQAPAPPAVTAAEPVLSPADHRLLCITCDTDQPMASVVLLRSYALRDGRIVSQVTGERVACQACGAVFSIGPHGKFRQHPASLPYSSSGPGVGVSSAPAPPDAEQPQPPQHKLPIPLKRPDV